MNIHVNKTNPNVLKHLQDLLSEGNNAKILNFVKTTFAEQLPTYLNMAEEVSQNHNVVLQLKLNDLKRQVAYNEAMKKLNELLDADEKRFGLK